MARPVRAPERHQATRLWRRGKAEARALAPRNARRPVDDPPCSPPLPVVPALGGSRKRCAGLLGRLAVVAAAGEGAAPPSARLAVRREPRAAAARRARVTATRTQPLRPGTNRRRASAVRHSARRRTRQLKHGALVAAENQQEASAAPARCAPAGSALAVAEELPPAGSGFVFPGATHHAARIARARDQAPRARRAVERPQVCRAGSPPPVARNRLRTTAHPPNTYTSPPTAPRPPVRAGRGGQPGVSPGEGFRRTRPRAVRGRRRLRTRGQARFAAAAGRRALPSSGRRRRRRHFSV